MFVTLKLTTRDPRTGKRGRDIFCSGMVTAATRSTITLDVEHHATGPWDRDSTRSVTIERKRIRYMSKPIPLTMGETM